MKNCFKNPSFLKQMWNFLYRTKVAPLLGLWYKFLYVKLGSDLSNTVYLKFID
jgi:hypothetical protein